MTSLTPLPKLVDQPGSSTAVICMAHNRLRQRLSWYLYLRIWAMLEQRQTPAAKRSRPMADILEAVARHNSVSWEQTATCLGTFLQKVTAAAISAARIALGSTVSTLLTREACCKLQKLGDPRDPPVKRKKRHQERVNYNG